MIRATWDSIARFVPQARQDRLMITKPTADEWFMENEHRGFVGLKMSERECQLKVLFVFPEWRRRGIGKAMVSDVIAYAGARSIKLSAGANLQRFYISFGFVKVSPQKRGAWIMRRAAHD